MRKGIMKTAPKKAVQVVSFKLVCSLSRVLAKTVKSAHDKAAPNMKKSPLSVALLISNWDQSPLITKDTPTKAITMPKIDLRETFSMRRKVPNMAAKTGVADMRMDALDALV